MAASQMTTGRRRPPDENSQPGTHAVRLKQDFDNAVRRWCGAAAVAFTTTPRATRARGDVLSPVEILFTKGDLKGSISSIA